MDLALEWDRHPGTGLRLACELAGMAGEPELEDIAPAADDSDLIGIVAARRGGELAGWAELRRDGPGRAWAEVLYAARYVRRIRLGHYDFEAATGEEESVVRTLIAGAAQQARVAGLQSLSWEGADVGPEGLAAVALGARMTDEYARLWTAEPRSWMIPPELCAEGRPGCVLQALAESADPLGQIMVVALPGRPAGDPVATIATSIVGSEAYINVTEGFSYRIGDARTLASLVGALIVELHDELPHVLVLRVYEADDAIARSALAIAGLDIAARFHRYELTLA
ncbi:hypothetical protein NDR87_13265 [Nocardia sp. CDC159]|uniref:Uncharacterized protein n=1 Tax=Nocardia pulmonis TaxID=2951408 RepID=A0A9X2E6L3_9NOCA|nr:MULTISPECIES: hypothetical protein [Nocardia]MCM6774606.1 hypothetical protein [Nocardia pulmonis]MCM6787329.1 hypothetical protein [Nocardia sp. CDC159]